jgi:hypothetical protein
MALRVDVHLYNGMDFCFFGVALIPMGPSGW